MHFLYTATHGAVARFRFGHCPKNFRRSDSISYFPAARGGFGQKNFVWRLAFALGNEFGLPNCSLLCQRANSACRTARFLVSGRIRLVERLTFGSADEFGLSNGSLLSQRANSACRTARFWVSGRIRLAERLAFAPAEEFGLSNGLLLGQRANSARRTARF